MTENNTLSKLQSGKQRRITSIDLFRGFLLTVMIVDHFILYYGNEASGNNLIYFLINDGIAGWGAGGFLLVMGMSQVLSARRLEKADNLILFKKALLRGSYIFVVGLIMLIMSFGPDDLWRWDILTIIGFATVVLFFCRFLPNWALITVVAVMVVVTPVLRGLPVSEFEWNVVLHETPFISRYLPGMFLDSVTQPDFIWRFDQILKGFFLWGEFPLFPWLVFSILGFIIGRRIVNGKFKTDIPIVLTIGAALVLLGFTGAYLGRSIPTSSIINGFISPFCFYPNSFTMSIYQIGITLIIFSILFYIFDVKLKDTYKPGPVGKILKRTSNFSLTFYFIHYMLLGWPLLIVYAVTGKYLAMDLMGFIPSIFCGFAVLTALEILLFYWEKSNSKYSFEWGLTKLIRLTVKN